MKTLSDIFITEKLESIKSKPANDNYVGYDVDYTINTGPNKPDPYGLKTTPEEPRVSLFQLEDAYLNDPTIYKGINNIVEVIMSANYRIEGDPDSVNYIENFIDELGNKGGKTNWDRLLQATFRHQCIYGRAFHEVIYNSDETKILDVDFLDPKKMDYAKNAASRILMDKYSNPVGYIESVPLQDIYNLAPLKSDPIPKDVILLANQIYFRTERIIQYKLFEAGDGFYSIGLVEPIYNVSKWKRTMLEALANVYYHTAFPVKGFKVGDQTHEPTRDLLEKTLKQVAEGSNRSTYVYPYYVEPTIIEAKNVETVNEYVKQFNEQEISVLGPSAFITGSGEKANKSVLARQEFLWKLTLKDIIKRTVYTIEKDLFGRIARMNNLESIPKISWGEINMEDLDSKADRLLKYVNAGLLTPDDKIENNLRKFEDFEPMEIFYGEQRRNKASK